ncbi:MAG: septation protein SepH [Actinomycetota bacterium]
MIKLRVVGSSNDLESLILTSRKQGRRGSHVVAIDEKLFRTLEDVVRKRRAQEKAEAPRRSAAETKMAPRDVQRLLRAGRPVDQIAKLAGMPVAWIERFLGPVLDERAVAIQDSQRARLEKPRLGLSSLPLGDAVARNLRARRVRITDAELAAMWDASRADAQPWVISLTFPYRGSEQRAVWRFDPRTGEVSAGNRLGSDIGWVAQARRAAAPSPKRAAPKKAATKRKPPAKRKTASSKRKPAPKRKPLARRKSAAKRRTASRPARRAPARRTGKRGRR